MNGLPFVITRRMNRISAGFTSDPDPATLDYLNEIVALIRELPFEVDLSKLQDRCYELLRSSFPVHASEGETEWTRRFAELCDRLQLHVPQVPAEERAPIHAT
jgi:hypothetical protein